MAVPPLRALVGAGHEIAMVVTRPDRKRGRGGALSPSPVKAAALELGLPVTHKMDAVPDVGVELAVVVAFGRIIPTEEVLGKINAVTDADILRAAARHFRGSRTAQDS